jgi:small subunit ribosomal protein S8
MNDLISDMITRIRNAQKSRLLTLECPGFKLGEQILEVLVDEGYIESFEKKVVKPGIFSMFITLKYSAGSPAILEINRVSKPGRKVYFSVDELETSKWYNGLGVLILTTSRGIMSDKKARELNVGGEVICNVF